MFSRFARNHFSQAHVQEHLAQVDAQELERESLVQQEVERRTAFADFLRNTVGLAEVAPDSAEDTRQAATEAMEAKVSPLPAVGQEHGFEQVRLAHQWFEHRQAYLLDRLDDLKRPHLAPSAFRRHDRMLVQAAAHSCDEQEAQQIRAFRQLLQGDVAVLGLFARAASEHAAQRPHRLEPVNPFEFDREIALRSIANAIDDNAYASARPWFEVTDRATIDLPGIAGRNEELLCRGLRSTLGYGREGSRYIVSLLTDSGHDQPRRYFVPYILLCKPEGMQMEVASESEITVSSHEEPPLWSGLDAVAIARSLAPDSMPSFDTPVSLPQGIEQD